MPTPVSTERQHREPASLSRVWPLVLLAACSGSAGNFPVPAGLAVTGLTPASGVSGTPVTIEGEGFEATATLNLVRFNGQQALVTSASPTRLRVVVPTEATTGRVTVTVGATTAISSADFIVPASPIAPTIVTQPQSVTVTEGDSATFAVVADGSPPLRFQWRFAGAEVAGATDAAHTIAAVTEGHEGSYSVEVSNSAGAVTSSPATLTIATGGGGGGGSAGGGTGGRTSDVEYRGANSTRSSGNCSGFVDSSTCVSAAEVTAAPPYTWR
jgi:hypothetical protein